MIKTLDLEYNGHQFADKIFKLILLYENCWILIQISLKSVPKDLSDKNVRIGSDNGWSPNRWLMNTCVTQSQWVKD